MNTVPRPPSAAVHFVGFRGAEYLSAVRVWGQPGFIHMGWDKRAQREICEGDVVVFAAHLNPDQPPEEKSYADTRECSRLDYLSQLSMHRLRALYGDQY